MSHAHVKYYTTGSFNQGPEHKAIYSQCMYTCTHTTSQANSLTMNMHVLCTTCKLWPADVSCSWVKYKEKQLTGELLPGLTHDLIKIVWC